MSEVELVVMVLVRNALDLLPLELRDLPLTGWALMG